MESALEHVNVYRRGGIPRGLAAEDFDPPAGVIETIGLNAIAIYLPKRLYIADLLPEILKPGGHAKNQRKAVREYVRPLGITLPSGFEVRSGQLITFLAIDEASSFRSAIDLGTVTPLLPREFFGVDENQERTFKSLLRLTLQDKLYRHRVRWFHEEEVFAFLPREDNDLIREERWTGRRENSRVVFERKLNKKDESKTFVCKHFAFAADFVLNGESWFTALTPDWYFSYGEDYKKSLYADEHMAWLKRHENNKVVADHFRFLHAWLGALDTDDLLNPKATVNPGISFGEQVRFLNHPTIDDARWLPYKSRDVEDEERFRTARLFDWT